MGVILALTGYTAIMIGLRGLARTLLAGYFVAIGLNSWKRSSGLAEPTADTLEPVRSAIPGSLSPEQLVKGTAGVQVAAGGLFALGVAPRVMAIVLGATLVPTALVERRVGDDDGTVEPTQQQISLLQHGALLGGLIFAALDTGGRPSVFWSGRRAVSGLADSVSSTTHSIADRLPTS